MTDSSLPFFQRAFRRFADLFSSGDSNRASNGRDRMHLALDGAGLGAWEWDLSTGEQVVNARWLEMLGYPVSRQRFSFASWKRLIHPEDYRQVMTALKEHLAGHSPVYEAEYRLKTHGGEWKWVQARGRVMVRDPQGKPLRLAGTQHDLTERKKIEARLKEQDERLRGILASLPEVVWSFSPDFSTLFYLNGSIEEVFGYPAEAFYDDNHLWMNLIHQEDQSAIAGAIQEIPWQSWIELSYRILRADGETRWVRTRGQVIRDSIGQPVRIDGTTIDITDRKQALDALRRRDSILNAVSAVADRLFAATAWQDVLPEMLERLGQAAQASRAYVIQALPQQPGETQFRQVGEWVSSGTSTGMDLNHPGLDAIRAPVFQRWESVLSAGQILQGEASSFPENEQPYLESFLIRSIIVVPIHVNGVWWGFISLDDCQAARLWLPAEEDALKVAANLLSAAIQREQANVQLQRAFESEHEERRAAQVLRETSLALNQSLNFDRILDRLLDQVSHLVPYDGACVLLVIHDRAYVARMRGYEQTGPKTFNALSLRYFEVPSTPNLRRLLKTHQPLLIPDTAVDPTWVRVVDELEYRSWIGAPLILEKWASAILWLDKIEPNFYTPVHSERLALFAGQASLALRNAQLFAETAAALEREQQMGEITRAISSELDLATILPQVTRLAVEMSGAEAGSMAILDETNQVLRSPYLFNLPEDLTQDADLRGESVPWQIIDSRQSLLLANYASHPLANPRWVKAGVRAFLGVPVIVGATCLGSLAVVSFDPDKNFGLREQAMVELVGRQAAVAIQNARLYEAARRRAAEAETLRQAASAVSSDLELDQVLNKILDQLASVVPYDSAAIFLYENEQLRIKAARGFENPAILDSRFTAQNSLIQSVDQTQTAVILPDAQTDPRFTPTSETNHIHGWIGLPLRVRDVSIGFLTIDSRQVGAYNQADASLAQAFADEVAIAIENARLFKQIQHLAITDPLTGLYNRHYFFEAAPREFEHARRYQTPLSVIILDLDRFKRVNDTYGHIAGDEVLAAVALRCRQSLREVDIIARYGGEEFIILLPQTNLEGARLLANRLRERIIYPPVDAAGQHIPVSASLGVAALDEACTNLQELVRRADAALYATKRTSRGNVSVWTIEMD